MKQRRFGKDGPSVSEIGLGTWQLGGADWGDMSDEQAQAILHAAADQGINLFDTADVYGAGLSEERLGRFLKSRSGLFFVATKLGRFPEPGWPGNFTPEAIRMHTEASLRRLGVEALDLTQLHCIPHEVLKRGEVFETLRALQQEGKIRRWGVSVESMAEAETCLEQEGLASLQIIFNMLRQHPLEAIFSKAQAQGIALIVRLPLASGLLAGKWTRDTHFPENDHRSYNRDGKAFNVGETLAGYEFEMGLDLVRDLQPLLGSGTDPLSVTALRWCLDFEAVTTVIPGATRIEQVAQNASASSRPPLSPFQHNLLRWFYETRAKQHIRGPL